MPKYERIVFIDGDESSEPLRILYGKTDDSVVWSGPDHVEAAVEYLAQWDYGDGGDVQPEPAAGSSDSTARHGDYLLSWNLGLSYIGLERVIPDASA